MFWETEKRQNKTKDHCFLLFTVFDISLWYSKSREMSRSAFKGIQSSACYTFNYFFLSKRLQHESTEISRTTHVVKFCPEMQCNSNTLGFKQPLSCTWSILIKINYLNVCALHTQFPSPILHPHLPNDYKSTTQSLLFCSMYTLTSN